MSALQLPPKNALGHTDPIEYHKTLLELVKEPTVFQLGEINLVEGMKYVDMFQIDAMYEAYSFGPESAKTILGYKYVFYWRDGAPLVGAIVKNSILNSVKKKLGKASNFFHRNANKCATAVGNRPMLAVVNEDVDALAVIDDFVDQFLLKASWVLAPIVYFFAPIVGFLSLICLLFMLRLVHKSKKQSVKPMPASIEPH
jgi:hypothetical protein